MADLGYIHPQLRDLAVPIDSLGLDPENARGHGPENIEGIKASLERFGQRRVAVIKQGQPGRGRERKYPGGRGAGMDACRSHFLRG